MLDFSLKIYRNLLDHASALAPLPFLAFLENGISDGIVLRHDVDKLPGHSLAFARLQREMGVHGSYYFRIVPESFNPKIIEEIAGMGKGRDKSRKRERDRRRETGVWRPEKKRDGRRGEKERKREKGKRER